jgi:hypothetical protein
MVEDDKQGAEAQFEFDRMTVERFRQTFPKARWDDVAQAWWVPGKTAEHRIARWRALEQTKADIHADAKGRDAFVFDPIPDSPYLETGAELVVRTPYSRTVVEELRQVPYARWDDVRRAWVVAFRSYEDLKRRWPVIEAAARRNEPEERKARRDAVKGSLEHATAQRRNSERKRRRYPVPADELPPLERPVSTTAYGIVAFTGSTGELVDELPNGLYEGVGRDRDLIWTTWRAPTLQELVEAWPSRSGPVEIELSRGWWQPTKAELIDARRAAKSRERRKIDD